MSFEMSNRGFTQWFALTLLSLAMLHVAALSAVADTPSDKADALLNSLIKPDDPGLAVLVAQNGKILFEKGYGLADREHHLPVVPETTFRIGPVTLQFTAAAILKLQEEGKLNVDDKLSKYVPDFPRGDEVTLRQLLTHTSGIHDYADDADFLGDAINATTTDALIGEMKKFPNNFDPGAKWRYDNSGYVLLGCIVEKVSGQSYGDFLRENFFQPLGMTDTGVQRAGLKARFCATSRSSGQDLRVSLRRSMPLPKDCRPSCWRASRQAARRGRRRSLRISSASPPASTGAS
jgi:CubicO group peptidase (beta-lactamase class C family)